jgi:hypothetical protein
MIELLSIRRVGLEVLEEIQPRLVCGLVYAICHFRQRLIIVLQIGVEVDQGW